MSLNGGGIMTLLKHLFYLYNPPDTGTLKCKYFAKILTFKNNPN
ncbi:hypothetical protein DCCM_3202 [Desulfocucumis palustris]|uniref:Uncharacterized protein n=1 Tax=Desulfocucumis palustris TaxID=1898651 RepID=A0A2L2XD68_9FIRM|nr:hypothetical protein DCCM_3202 [Desulfocucumis palustris]